MANSTLRVRRVGPRVVAPDEVPVWPTDLAPAEQMALAKGELEPGAAYRPHAHRTIEQLTYVLTGRIRVTSFDADEQRARSVVVEAGESVVSLPWETMEFACAGDSPARVLYCDVAAVPGGSLRHAGAGRAPADCGRGRLTPSSSH